MPAYEYACTKCGETIEVWATLAEKEKGLKVVCPKCGSHKTARLFSSFTTIGSSKGRGKAAACGPESGPACCR